MGKTKENLLREILSVITEEGLYTENTTVLWSLYYHIEQ